MKSSRSGPLAMGVLATAGLLLAGLSLPAAAGAAQPVTIEVESGRADSVSGGDALVSVAGARDDFRVLAAGVDVTDSFQPLDGRLVGVVDGLPLGVSEIQVTKRNGQVQSTLEVENHPITGPVFSGPQHVMYCTADRAPWNLGAVDEDCHVAGPTVSYRYRTTAGQFANYDRGGGRSGRP